MLSLKFNFTRIFTSIAIASIAIFIFLQILAPVQAATGINRQINFQGKLVNNPAATNVTDTSYTIVFTLYDNASGANTALWTETQTVTTVDGIFRVALGSVTPFPANFNFNWSGLYLGIKVNADAEMTPRVQMAAVPFAFNAEKVAGLTVQDTSGNASTSGTLQVANGVTVKLPVSGTSLIYADTASTGTLATLSNSTTQTGNVIGQAITLAGATGSLNQTGLQFNLSGVTSGTVLDIQGTGNSWYVTRNGALTVASCTGCGGGGTNFWGSVGGLNYPLDTRSDLAIGSTSTASALFSFTGIKTGQTIASTSGQFILMPNNGWGGQVGIGTTAPTAGYTLDTRGHSIFGNQQAADITASPDKVLYVNELTTDTTNNVFNLAGSLEANPAGATSKIYYGGFFNVRSTSTNAQNFTGRLVGFQGQVDHFGTGVLSEARGFAGFAINDSSGIISNAYAGKFGLQNASTGSITNGYGVYINSPANTGGGTFNTNYGLYVQDQSNVGIVGSYNIWSDGFNSKNYFAGNVGIGATPSARLHVAGSWGSNAAVIVDQLNSGDILAASASGATKFAIGLNGNLQLVGGLTSDIDTLTGTTLKIGTSNSTGVTIGKGGITTTILGFLATTWMNGSLLFSGVTTDITTNTNEQLTITPNGTGNVLINPDSGGQAALIVNKTGNLDIFTASSSGTTRFTITNVGGIKLAASEGSLNNCLLSGGAGAAASWNTCPGGSSSSGPFAELTNLGLIVPNNSTEDFLIGGHATTSADFSFTGMATGKTIASISGNLIVYPNNGWGGYLGVNTLNPLANLTVLGTGLFQTPTASKAAFQVQNTNGAPVFIVDTTNPTNLLTNPGFETGISGWNVKTSSTISWNNLAKNFVYLGQASIKVVTATSANSGVSTNTFTQTITAGTYSISFYAKMGSGTLTTLNAGYNQGAADVPCSLNNNAVNNKGFQRYTCTFTSSGSLSYIYIDQGATTTSNTIYIDSVQLQSGNSITPYAIGTLELRGVIDAPASFQSGSDSITALQIQNAAGTSNLFIADTLDNAIGIGTNAPLATLDVRSLTGTTSIASVAGATTFAGLVVDNSGTGDIFTASASGATRFVIAQNGTVTIGTSTNGLTFNPVNGGPTYSGTARILKTITLSPEYAGAVLTSSGSATINGSMTSDASPSANWRTYYEWTSTQTSLQDYTVAVRVTLPSDFSDWQANNALSIDYETASNIATTNKFDLIIFNPSDPKPSTPVVMRTANVSATGKTWSSLNIPNSALTAGTARWEIASQSATFYIKMYASGTYNYVHVGDIDLNYIAKF